MLNLISKRRGVFMKTIYLLLFLWGVMFITPLLAQEKGSFYLSADSLQRKDFVGLSDMPWKYHSGDDPRWADLSFNDQSWQLLSPMFDLDSLPPKTWRNIGWFRINLVVDSSLFHTTVALQLSHPGASEIYLDGKFIHGFGVIGSYQGQEELYNPKHFPVTLPLNEKATHVLAIRYSYEKATSMKARFGVLAGKAGFYVGLANVEKAITKQLFKERVVAQFEMTLFGILVALAFLHLLLYLFYASGGENLWYSIFTGSMAGFFLFSFLHFNSHHIESSSWYALLLAAFFLPMMFVSYNAFLYAIFYPSTPRQFKWIVLTAVVVCLLQVWQILGPKINEFVLPVFILLSTFEGLRVIILALWHKKKDAGIISRGVIGFVLLVLFLFLMAGNVFAKDILESTQAMLAYGGLLSIPISMAIYLARRTARTNHNLEAQLMEVSRLSKQSLKQEVEKYKLIESQKQELKAQVEERTRELRETNRNLNQINEELNVTLENLKAAQLQLVQSEKMASLGQLTAGVAHEINNPINFVSAGIDSLKINYQEIIQLAQQYFALQPDEDNRQQLTLLAERQQEIEVKELVKESEQLFKSIKNGAVRTTDIVKSLRNFTRLDEDALKKADVHEGLDSTLTILHNQIKERIQVVKEYGNLPSINCYPGQLNQVFMNILSNAAHAIQGQGTILIRTHLKDEAVVICIKDSGRGMTEEVKKRIFEPFFTTKDVGEGTGLGLSISYGIIEKHRGSIRIESEPGKGTEFIIHIPLDLQ
jgi:two-component system NtrC family sensor kinase